MMAMRTPMCLDVVEVKPDLKNMEAFWFLSPTTQGTQMLVRTDLSLKNLSSSRSTGSSNELTSLFDSSMKASLFSVAKSLALSNTWLSIEILIDGKA